VATYRRAPHQPAGHRCGDFLHPHSRRRGTADADPPAV